MPKSDKPRSRRPTSLQRAALVAAAGIAAAAAADMDAWAASHIPASAVMVTTRGISIHSEALAAALTRDRVGTLRRLQSRFPGLTADQVTVGAGSMVTFNVGRAAFNRGIATMGNAGCPSNTQCSVDNTGCESGMWGKAGDIASHALAFCGSAPLVKPGETGQHEQ